MAVTVLGEHFLKKIQKLSMEELLFEACQKRRPRPVLNLGKYYTQCTSKTTTHSLNLKKTALVGESEETS
jgi:hypothetical protein